MSENTLLGNTVKLIGETHFIPGSSQLLDGNVKAGAVYVALGLVSKRLLGGTALWAVAADSFARSVSGKGLLDHIREAIPSKKSAAPAEPELVEATPPAA